MRSERTRRHQISFAHASKLALIRRGHHLSSSPSLVSPVRSAWVLGFIRCQCKYDLHPLPQQHA
eukprot:2684759-Amphidinium_carterae.1